MNPREASERFLLKALEPEDAGKLLQCKNFKNSPLLAEC